VAPSDGGAETKLNASAASTNLPMCNDTDTLIAKLLAQTLGLPFKDVADKKTKKKAKTKFVALSPHGNQRSPEHAADRGGQ